MQLTFIPAQEPGKRYSIKWKKLAVLPGGRPLGFAGAVTGISGDVLIIAGGANFPDGPPWEGGKKYYSSAVYVLQKDGNRFSWNQDSTFQLPEPVAYCGNASTERGIVCVGGENGKEISSKCYLINWDTTQQHIVIKQLPDLPVPLTNVAVTHTGNIVYAAGGDGLGGPSNNFFSLDLNDPNPEWAILPRLPIALANATAITQSGSSGEEVFIIGGRSRKSSEPSDLHHTVFAYNIARQTWRRRADISDGKKVVNLSAATGVALGKNDILIAGGDNGVIFHRIEKIVLEISKAGTQEEKERLARERDSLTIYHKGFDRRLFLYNTITDRWAKTGELPFPAQVTATALMWDDCIVIASGEIRPGVRTPDIVIGQITTSHGQQFRGK